MIKIGGCWGQAYVRLGLGVSTGLAFGGSKFKDDF